MAIVRKTITYPDGTIEVSERESFPKKEPTTAPKKKRNIKKVVEDESGSEEKEELFYGEAPKEFK